MTITTLEKMRSIRFGKGANLTTLGKFLSRNWDEIEAALESVDDVSTHEEAQALEATRAWTK